MLAVRTRASGTGTWPPCSHWMTMSWEVSVGGGQDGGGGEDGGRTAVGGGEEGRYSLLEGFIDWCWFFCV